MALVRARKHLVSLLADSRAGRSLLLSALGDSDVAAVLETLAGVVAAFGAAVAAGSVEGHPERAVDAAAVSRATLKLTGKLFVVIRLGHVAARELVPLQLPMVAAGMQLAAALEQAARGGGSGGGGGGAPAADVRQLSAAIAAAAASVAALAAGRLKPSSLEQLAALGRLYASSAFLAFVLDAPALATPRAVLARALQRVVRRGGGDAGGGGTRAGAAAGGIGGGSVTRRSRHTVPRGDVLEWPTTLGGDARGRALPGATPAPQPALPAAPPIRTLQGGHDSTEPRPLLAAAPPLAPLGAASNSNSSSCGGGSGDGSNSSSGSGGSSSSGVSFPARSALASPASQPTLALISVLGRPAWAGLVAVSATTEGGVDAAATAAPAALADWLEVPECAGAFTAYVAALAFAWRAKRALGEAVGDYSGDPAASLASARGAGPGGGPGGGGGSGACVGRGAPDFVSSLLPCDPWLLLELRHAVVDYRAVSSRPLRAQRGCALFAKYLVRPSATAAVASAAAAASAPSQPPPQPPSGPPPVQSGQQQQRQRESSSLSVGSNRSQRAGANASASSSRVGGGSGGGRSGEFDQAELAAALRASALADVVALQRPASSYVPLPDAVYTPLALRMRRPGAAAAHTTRGGAAAVRPALLPAQPDSARCDPGALSPPPSQPQLPPAVEERPSAGDGAPGRHGGDDHAFELGTLAAAAAMPHGSERAAQAAPSVGSSSGPPATAVGGGAAPQAAAPSDPRLFDGVLAHAEGVLLQGLYAHAGPGGFRASREFGDALAWLRVFVARHGAAIVAAAPPR